MSNKHNTRKENIISIVITIAFILGFFLLANYGAPVTGLATLEPNTIQTFNVNSVIPSTATLEISSGTQIAQINLSDFTIKLRELENIQPVLETNKLIAYNITNLTINLQDYNIEPTESVTIRFLEITTETTIEPVTQTITKEEIIIEEIISITENITEPQEFNFNIQSFEFSIQINTDTETVAQIYQTNILQNAATEISIQFNNQTLVGSNFTHDIVTNNHRLTFNEAGWYKVSYGCTILQVPVSAGAREEITVWLENETGDEIPASRTYTYLRDSEDDRDKNSVSAVTLVNMETNGYLTLQMIHLYGAENPDPEESCYIYAEKLHRPAALIYETTNYDNTLSTSVHFNQDFDATLYEDTGNFTVDLANNVIAVDEEGWYKMYYTVSSEQTSGTNDKDRVIVASYLYKNNTAELKPSKTYSYHKRADQAAYSSEEGFTMAYLNAGENISVRRYYHKQQQATAVSSSISPSWLLMERIEDNNILLLWDATGGQRANSGGNYITGTPVNITWDTQGQVGSNYTHTAGQETFTIEGDGIFEISYAVSFSAPTGGGRKISCARLLQNNIYIEPSQQCTYERDNTAIEENSVSANFIVNNTAGDEYILQHNVIGDSADEAADLIADSSWVTVMPVKTIVTAQEVDATPPTTTLQSPTNNTNSSTSSVNFTYQTSDTTSDVDSCILWLQKSGTWELNYTDTSITESVDHSINLTVDDQNMLWRVECNDTLNNRGNSTTYNITIDTTDPVVNLQSPQNNSLLETSYVNFTYNVTDNFEIKNCSLYLQKSGTWQLNKSDSTITETINQSINITIEDGSFNWTVGCYDSALNQQNTTVYNLTVDVPSNQPPTHTTPILNSTFGTNLTTENLTCYNQSTSDADSDSVKNIFNWYKNDVSLQVLNMPFEGGLTAESGTKVRDYSSNANNGSEIGGPVWNSNGGYDGKGAYEFNGASDYLNVSSDLSAWLGTTATLTAWIKTTQTGSDTYWQAPGITGVEIAGSNDIFWGWIDASGNIGIGKDDAGVKSSKVINDDVWHFVAFTRDSSTGDAEVYIDGELNASGITGTGVATTPFYSIGRIEDTGGSPEDFDGTIDDLRVFNRVLSAEQIQAIYQNRTDLIVSQETTAGENWTCEVTPNDGTQDGSTLKSGNLTILEVSINQAPTIPVANITQIQDTGITLNDKKQVSFTFVVSDADGTSGLEVGANFTGEGNFKDNNLSCTTTGWSNTTALQYNCTFDIWYFYKAGSWNFSMNATDGTDYAFNNGSTFQLGLTTGIQISPSALSWGTLYLNKWNSTSANDPILINNTGNYNISLSKVNITAYNLKGETTTTEEIPAANFTIDIETSNDSPPNVECDGTAMLNATSTDITNSMLPRGNHSINDGETGQEQLYLCLVHVPSDIEQQSYSTENSEQWVIGVS